MLATQDDTATDPAQRRTRLKAVIAGVLEDHPGPDFDAVAEDLAAAVLAAASEEERFVRESAVDQKSIDVDELERRIKTPETARRVASAIAGPGHDDDAYRRALQDGRTAITTIIAALREQD